MTETIRLYSVREGQYITTEKVEKSEDEWRALLTPEQFAITRHAGTEPPFCGGNLPHTTEGVYECVCCGNDLFYARTKFESGTGWPSFWEPVAAENVTLLPDTSYGMHRTEVLCARCDAHLGHVFEDGPPPTGLRYCVNAAALKFVSL